MRVVNEINHPLCKITIFLWNNRYLLKFEQGHLEQTYKIDQFEVTHEQDLQKILSEDFIQRVSQMFETMANSLNQSLLSI
jgi:hypothetical protein